jgi:hypothetical protein
MSEWHVVFHEISKTAGKSPTDVCLGNIMAAFAHALANASQRQRDRR